MLFENIKVLVLLLFFLDLHDLLCNWLFLLFFLYLNLLLIDDFRLFQLRRELLWRLNHRLLPFEGALQGRGGPEHEFGLDADLKQVSHVRIVIELQWLRQAEFNVVLAFLELAQTQVKFEFVAYVDDQRILKIDLGLLNRILQSFE